VEIQYPLTGRPEEKLTACLKAAGWYEGREVSPEKMKQITEFYASGGITLPEGAKNFIREFHGLAEGWYLNLSAEKYSWRPPDAMFKIFPDSEAEGLDYAARLDREEQPLCVQENLEEMCDLAGEPVVWIGIIGYQYPLKIYMGSTRKLFVMTAWNDADVVGSLSEMMTREFVHHPEWSFVTVRRVYDEPARPISRDKSSVKDLVQKKKEEAGYMDYPYKVGVQVLSESDQNYYDENNMHEFLVAVKEHPWGIKFGQGPLSVNVGIIGYVDLTDGRKDDTKRLMVWDPSPEEQVRGGPNNFPFYGSLFEEKKIYRIRGLLPKTPENKAKGGFKIREIVSADEHDEYLEKLIEDFYKIRIVESEYFGEMRYSEKSHTISGSCNWMGTKISIYLESKPEYVQECLPYLEWLYVDQKRWDKMFRDKVVDDLLYNANDWLENADEPEITGEEFAERIKIECIEMGDDGFFTAWFDDDDIFAGHSVVVYGDVNTGVDQARMEG